MTFRTIDGSNNNQNNPEYGQTDEHLLRFTPVAYADGIEALANPNAPNPRTISNTVFNQSESTPDPRNLSDYGWAWGQFIDHDITLTEPQSGNDAESANIIIPQGDTVYTPGSFIPVTRSLFDEDTSTNTNNPREHSNEITAWFDASQVYGSDESRANWLRSFEGGKLKVSTHSTGDLLPTRGNDSNAPSMAMDETIGPSTFVAGDVRANENPVLASLHTLFVREHNRLAEIIDATHTDLPTDTTARDEEIYQRARKIVGAATQAITYNEYLPALGVTLDPYNGYNGNLNPNINTEFSTAGFRLGHTQISGTLQRLNEDGTEAPVGELDLFAGFFQPQRITDDGGIAPVLRGLASQVQQKTDAKIIDDLRNLLFTGAPGGGPVANGTDLAALNIQRSRDHGLANYNQIRVAFGLPRVNNFSDISSDPQVALALEEVYGDVDNTELWVGMLSEDNLPGASIGELNQAILVDQFKRLRDGDRFWYENDHDLSQWQLGESGTVLDWLDGVKLSDIIKLNIEIENISDDVFFVPDIVVTNTNDSGPGSLRRAIANADSGDTIVFDPRIGGQTINLTSGQLRIDQDLKIDGHENNPVTIDAGGNSRVFNINDGDNSTQSQVTIDGVIITGGNVTNSGGDGGGILNRENLTLTDSTITGNRANGNGGGIFNFGVAEIENTTITENQAINGQGGGIASFGNTSITSTTVTSSTITNNLKSDVDFVVQSQNSFVSGGNNIIGTGNAIDNFNQSTDEIDGNEVSAFIGTDGKDTLTGDNQDNTLIGNEGNDKIKGRKGDDELIGVNPDATAPGFREVDRLSGNGGSDTFILGDAEKVYYDDGKRSTKGNRDRAIISDFKQNQDKIQLHGSADDYELRLTRNRKHTQIFYVADQNQPEFIAQVLKNTNLDLDDSNQFKFVGLSEAKTEFLGTDGKDILTGDSEDNILIGNEGNDRIRGLEGDDELIGVNPDGSTPGVGEVDRLSGNEGSDTFILGDAEAVYYDDDRRNTSGNKDRAIIDDFDANEDRIQLHGNPDDYELLLTGNRKHTQIFYVADQNQPEFIAQVLRNNDLVLDTDQFDFV